MDEQAKPEDVKGSYDFTITGIDLHPWKKEDSKGFVITWGTQSAGFGELTFYQENGEWHCDNEGMSNTFIRSVFEFLINLCPENFEKIEE